MLQLDQRFNLPNNVRNKEKITFEYIKHIENNLSKLNERTKNSIRKEVIPILENIKFSFPNATLIKKGLKELNHFVADHPDLLIIRADKGNYYYNTNFEGLQIKLYEILSDKNTFIMIKKYPTSKLTMEMHTFLTRWRTKAYN